MLDQSSKKDIHQSNFFIGTSKKGFDAKRRSKKNILLENDNSATFVGFGLTSEDSNQNFRNFGIAGGKIMSGGKEMNESFMRKQDGKSKAKS